MAGEERAAEMVAIAAEAVVSSGSAWSAAMIRPGVGPQPRCVVERSLRLAAARHPSADGSWTVQRRWTPLQVVVRISSPLTRDIKIDINTTRIGMPPQQDKNQSQSS